MSTLIKQLDNGDVHGFESQNDDRPYDSLLFTKIFESTGLGGYAPSITDQMKVEPHPDNTTTNGQKVIIKNGAAMIAGHFVEIKAPIEIDFSTETITAERSFIIALKINRNSTERTISVITVAGAQGSSRPPFNELTTETLGLNTGIWEFPIAIINVKENSPILSTHINNVLKSINILEPINVVVDDIRARILIPNQDPINRNETISLYLKFPALNSSISAISINNFSGTETELQIKDANGLIVELKDLKNKEVFATLDITKGTCVIKELIGFSFDQGVLDETFFSLEGTTSGNIYNYFSNFPIGTKILLSTVDIGTNVDDNTIDSNFILPAKTDPEYGRKTFDNAIVSFKGTNKNNNNEIVIIKIEHRILGNIYSFYIVAEKDNTTKKIFKYKNLYSADDTLSSPLATQAFVNAKHGI